MFAAVLLLAALQNPEVRFGELPVLRDVCVVLLLSLVSLSARADTVVLDGDAEKVSKLIRLPAHYLSQATTNLRSFYRESRRISVSGLTFMHQKPWQIVVNRLDRLNFTIETEGDSAVALQRQYAITRVRSSKTARSYANFKLKAAALDEELEDRFDPDYGFGVGASLGRNFSPSFSGEFGYEVVDDEEQVLLRFSYRI